MSRNRAAQEWRRCGPNLQHERRFHVTSYQWKYHEPLVHASRMLSAKSIATKPWDETFVGEDISSTASSPRTVSRTTSLRCSRNPSCPNTCNRSRALAGVAQYDEPSSSRSEISFAGTCQVSRLPYRATTTFKAFIARFRSRGIGAANTRLTISRLRYGTLEKEFCSRTHPERRVISSSFAS
jgi:hypothetical protein